MGNEIVEMSADLGSVFPWLGKRQIIISFDDSFIISYKAHFEASVLTAFEVTFYLTDLLMGQYRAPEIPFCQLTVIFLQPARLVLLLDDVIRDLKIKEGTPLHVILESDYITLEDATESEFLISEIVCSGIKEKSFVVAIGSTEDEAGEIMEATIGTKVLPKISGDYNVGDNLAYVDPETGLGLNLGGECRLFSSLFDCRNGGPFSVLLRLLTEDWNVIVQFDNVQTLECYSDDTKGSVLLTRENGNIIFTIYDKDMNILFFLKSECFKVKAKQPEDENINYEMWLAAVNQFKREMDAEHASRN